MGFFSFYMLFALHSPSFGTAKLHVPSVLFIFSLYVPSVSPNSHHPLDSQF